MSTLLYAPDIAVVCDTRDGQKDISSDVIGFSLDRVTNGVSTLSLQLDNSHKRYQVKNGRSYLQRMGRVTVSLRRFRHIQAFTGYFDQVPIYSALPRIVNVTASCTIKRLVHSRWDPAAPESRVMFPYGTAIGAGDVNFDQDDGGAGESLFKMVTEVGGFAPKNVHIQKWPNTLQSRMSTLAQTIYQRNDQLVNHGMQFPSGSVAGKTFENLALPFPQVTKSFPGASTPFTAGVIRSLNQTPGNENNTGSLPPAARERLRSFFPYVCVLAYNEEDENYWINSSIQIYCPRTGNAIIVRPYATPDIVFGDDVPKLGEAPTLMSVPSTLMKQVGIEEGEQVFISLVDPKYGPGPQSITSTEPTDSRGYPAEDSTTAAAERYRQSQTSAGSTSTTDSTEYRYKSKNRDPSPYEYNIGVPGNPRNVSSSMRPGGFYYSNWGDPHTNTVQSQIVSAHLPGNVRIQTHSTVIPLWELLFGILAKYGYNCYSVGSYNLRHIGDDPSKPLSIHSWGLAVDINPADNPIQKTFRTNFPVGAVREIKSITLSNGVPIFKWGGDYKSLKDTMHWEVQAKPHELLKPIYIPNADPVVIAETSVSDPGVSGQSSGGSGGFTSVGSGAGTSVDSPFTVGLDYLNNIAGKLYSTVRVIQKDKSFMYTEPLFGSVESMASASLRHFMSSPTGDFVAFYPDYFGTFGKPPAMTIRDIETIDMTLDINDEGIVTHALMAGDTHPNINSSKLADGVGDMDWWSTRGLVSIEMQEIQQLMRDFAPTNYGIVPDVQSPDDMLKRFGARPLVEQIPQIQSHYLETLFAIERFTNAWANQFVATVPVTFMPEVYPGMRVRFADHGVTAYVERVNHTGSRSGGFQTNLTLSAFVFGNQQ